MATLLPDPVNRPPARRAASAGQLLRSVRMPGLLTRQVARLLFTHQGVPLALWLVAQGMAHAEDLTSDEKQDAQDTFGQNSTMMYYFMLAVVVLVFVLYLRSHNPATFLLIPAFIVITRIVFAILAARSGG